ncbi:MAG TPA: glycosyltransferase family 2 protein [Gemmataceae bacterium]|nr:glycosyltransferase family 2 protein [Gemmataceae bacterium]
MALALETQRALPGSGTRVRRTPRKPAPALQVPRVSVIIVNYRLWEETARLVGELRASPRVRSGEVEIVVVDNHSPFHPVVKRMRRWPGVSLRRWGRNRGFAHAVNEGCRLSRGQWLLLLNPDISIAPDFLDRVLSLSERLAEEEPRAGVVGFRLRNSDGSRQLSSGPFPTFAQTLLRLALPRTRRKYHFVQARRRRRVPWVTGCCMLLRRGCVEELGGLDRDFFLYYEDVDLCRRARAGGWSVWFEPKIKAVHHHPLHTRSVPAYMRLLTRHALLTYAAKHWPAWQLRLLAGLVEMEARIRKRLADRNQDVESSKLFGQLRALAIDIRRGQTAAARKRLEKTIRREERKGASNPAAPPITDDEPRRKRIELIAE